MAQAPDDQVKAVPESVTTIISKMPLEDEDENALKVLNVRYLEAHRRSIYAVQAPQMGKAQHVMSVECVPSDDSDDIKIEDKEITEKIIVINENEAEIIEIEDKITMEDLSPSKLIEYTFHADGPWYLAPMSLFSLEGYRKGKFKNWRHMMDFPDCEAAFKRLLNIGLITKMFDHVAFPSPDHEKEDWEVKDDHGKTVIIPRPVEALRVWNASSRCYEEVQAHLDGAPVEKDADKYWQDMLGKFRAERGKEYIDKLLQSFAKGAQMEAAEQQQNDEQPKKKEPADKK